MRLRTDVEQEVHERRAQLVKAEERMLSKEDEIDRKLTEVADRERGLGVRERECVISRSAQRARGA